MVESPALRKDVIAIRHSPYAIKIFDFRPGEKNAILDSLATFAF
jgi:hypothetical protein